MNVLHSNYTLLPAQGFDPETYSFSVSKTEKWVLAKCSRQKLSPGANWKDRKRMENRSLVRHASQYYLKLPLGTLKSPWVPPGTTSHNLENPIFSDWCTASHVMQDRPIRVNPGTFAGEQRTHTALFAGPRAGGGQPGALGRACLAGESAWRRT